MVIATNPIANVSPTIQEHVTHMDCLFFSIGHVQKKGEITYLQLQ